MGEDLQNKLQELTKKIVMKVSECSSVYDNVYIETSDEFAGEMIIKIRGTEK